MMLKENKYVFQNEAKKQSLTPIPDLGLILKDAELHWDLIARLVWSSNGIK